MPSGFDSVEDYPVLSAPFVTAGTLNAGSVYAGKPALRDLAPLGDAAAIEALVTLPPSFIQP